MRGRLQGRDPRTPVATSRDGGAALLVSGDPGDGDRLAITVALAQPACEGQAELLDLVAAVAGEALAGTSGS